MQKEALYFTNFLRERRKVTAFTKQKQNVIKNKLPLENNKLLEIKNMKAEMKNLTEHWRMKLR